MVEREGMDKRRKKIERIRKDKREKDKKSNKSLAVPEMGDCGHNRHGPKRGGLL